MKYLLILLLLSGCASDYKAEALESINKINARTGSCLKDIAATTNSMYFQAGEISCMCQVMKDHPQLFKPGKIQEFKSTCEKYKDFETFTKNLEANNLK